MYEIKDGEATSYPSLSVTIVSFLFELFRLIKTHSVGFYLYYSGVPGFWRGLFSAELAGSNYARGGV